MFFPLFSIQHRGQESAGIAYRKDGKTVLYKDLGMVSSVLGKYLSKDRISTCGIGHVRYSTHGGNKIENAQPLSISSNRSSFVLMPDTLSMFRVNKVTKVRQIPMVMG